MDEKKQSWKSAGRNFFFACITVTPLLICGCSHFYEGSQSRSFREANDFFNQGSYQASLNRYEQIMENCPEAKDRVLFEMGIIYAYPSNEQKNYQKSLECFQTLLRDYPESAYRQNSAEMISHINNVSIKDKKIITQQTKIENLEQALKSKENEVNTLKKKIETLEQEVFSAHKGPASKILIEKGERRLTLLSRDKILKRYQIALGGNPTGPKERQGDNRTPEGIYIIDSRNKDSRYHLSLHISYPNEKDRKRARQMGVSPGGDIMIHGLRNGFEWIGDYHKERDWTKGCIAVTNEEIEEIARLVPIGTIVEIKP